MQLSCSAAGEKICGSLSPDNAVTDFQHPFNSLIILGKEEFVTEFSDVAQLLRNASMFEIYARQSIRPHDLEIDDQTCIRILSGAAMRQSGWWISVLRMELS